MRVLQLQFRLHSVSGTPGRPVNWRFESARPPAFAAGGLGERYAAMYAPRGDRVTYFPIARALSATSWLAPAGSPLNNVPSGTDHVLAIDKGRPSMRRSSIGSTNRIPLV